MRRQPLLLRIAIASLAIGAYALVRNLISTFSTLQDYPSAQFLPVFLSTQSSTGGADIMLVFFVWGPLVFGGIGLALLIAHLVTRAAGAAVVGGGAVATAHAWAEPQQPQHGGWQPQQPQQPQQPVQGWQQQAPQQGWRPESQQQGWQPESQQQGWQPESQQQSWQPESQDQPPQQSWQPESQQHPVESLGSTPPPPNAADRIQP